MRPLNAYNSSSCYIHTRGLNGLRNRSESGVRRGWKTCHFLYQIWGLIKKKKRKKWNTDHSKLLLVNLIQFPLKQTWVVCTLVRVVLMPSAGVIGDAVALRVPWWWTGESEAPVPVFEFGFLSFLAAWPWTRYLTVCISVSSLVKGR